MGPSGQAVSVLHNVRPLGKCATKAPNLFVGSVIVRAYPHHVQHCRPHLRVLGIVA